MYAFIYICMYVCMYVCMVYMGLCAYVTTRTACLHAFIHVRTYMYVLYASSRAYMTIKQNWMYACIYACIAWKGPGADSCTSWTCAFLHTCMRCCAVYGLCMYTRIAPVYVCTYRTISVA
jgi:hypothetical protein